MKIKFKDVLYIKGRIGWQALKKDEYLTNGDYYLITGVDIKENHLIDFSNCYYVSKERYEMDDKIQVHNSDIIVTKDGTIGKIGYIDKLDKPATLNSHLFLIRNLRKDILDSKFLFYLLQSNSFKKYAVNNTSGSNIPAFTQKNLEEFVYDLPSLEEQKKISNTIDLIDKKINTNIAINDNLQQLIMDTYIQQFECFSANNQSMKYSDKLKRNIPNNWQVIQINKLASIESGYPFNSDDYEDTGAYKLITIKNVQDSGVDVDTGDRINKIPSDLPAYCKLKSKDILLSLTGNVGRVGLMYTDDCLLNQRVASITPLDESIRPYLFCLFKSQTMRITMERISGGTSQKNLSPIETSNIYIPFNLDAARDFSIKIEPVISKYVKCLEENLKLSQLKNELLPLLMNGQVSIA